MVPYNVRGGYSSSSSKTICQGQEEDVYRLFPPLFLLRTMQTVLLYYILSDSSVFMSTNHTVCSVKYMTLMV